MVQGATKLPVRKDQKPGKPEGTMRHPLQSLQREINQVFDRFDRGWPSFFQRSLFDIEPFGRLEAYWSSPAVDIADKEKSYEVTAEVPGMSAENVEVQLVNDRLVIKGEKKDSREEKQADSYLAERHYGSFERTFRLPEGVDTGKIEASLKNGVLTIVLPKTAEAVKPAKKIDVKAA